MRLLFTVYFYTVKWTFQFLWQFEWFQWYIAKVQWAFSVILKWWAWSLVFTLVAYFLWDWLPLVALGCMAYGVYRWRRRDAW